MWDRSGNSRIFRSVLPILFYPCRFSPNFHAENSVFHSFSRQDCSMFVAFYMFKAGKNWEVWQSEFSLTDLFALSFIFSKNMTKRRHWSICFMAQICLRNFKIRKCQFVCKHAQNDQISLLFICTHLLFGQNNIFNLLHCKISYLCTEFEQCLLLESWPAQTSWWRARLRRLGI